MMVEKVQGNQGVAGVTPSSRGRSAAPAGLSRQEASQAKPAAANAWTPGPWDAWTNEATYRPRVRLGSSGGFWFPAYFDGECMEQHCANARLIAAAPDLAAACQAVAASSMRNEAYDLCVAAISKLNGE